MTWRDRLTTLAAALAGVAAFAVTARVLDPALLAGRARLSAADDVAIREAVSTYNRIYEDFYASGGRPNLIDELPATRSVKHRIFRDIGFIRDEGLVQVQDLASATVREVLPVGPGEASALVYEEWNYILQGSVDRAPKSELKGTAQWFRYRLRKESGRWIITGWDMEDRPAPALERGFLW